MRALDVSPINNRLISQFNVYSPGINPDAGDQVFQAVRIQVK